MRCATADRSPLDRAKLPRGQCAAKQSRSKSKKAGSRKTHPNRLVGRLLSQVDEPGLCWSPHRSRRRRRSRSRCLWSEHKPEIIWVLRSRVFIWCKPILTGHDQRHRKRGRRRRTRTKGDREIRTERFGDSGNEPESDAVGGSNRDSPAPSQPARKAHKPLSLAAPFVCPIDFLTAFNDP
jgi:hypothetical protein